MNMRKKYYKSDLQREMRKYFKGQYYTHVYSEVNGTSMYLNETEVRFLQYKCKLAAENGEFDNFVKNTIVYDGPRKRDGKPMVFREDGMFSTEFQKGFFHTNFDLLYELL